MAASRGPQWLGAHITISQGLPKAAELARTLGGNTFAYFTRNPRGGAARTIGEEEIAAWKVRRLELGIGPTVGHMPYTVNLAAQDGRIRDFAAMVVAEDFRRVEGFGGAYMCLHPGNHQGAGVKAGIAQVVKTLRETLPDESGTTMLLLEIMAGHGSEVGGSFEELAEIIDGAGAPSTLGVCLDSCHLSGEGYDFRQKKEIDRLRRDAERTVGLDRVRAVHLNDSKFEVGSHKDRHESWGKGFIGREGALNILTDPWLSTLPMVLETPVDDIKDYGPEISRLRNWLDELS